MPRSLLLITDIDDERREIVSVSLRTFRVIAAIYNNAFCVHLPRAESPADETNLRSRMRNHVSRQVCVEERDPGEQPRTRPSGKSGRKCRKLMRRSRSTAYTPRISLFLSLFTFVRDAGRNVVVVRLDRASRRRGRKGIEDRFVGKWLSRAAGSP